MKIYHNRSCVKSCETLTLLREKGVQPEIVEYLHTPPTRDELKELLHMLNLRPQQIIRTKEALYKTQFAHQQLSDEEWIDVLVANPRLIERPIVTDGKRAVIGRPPVKVLELID